MRQDILDFMASHNYCVISTVDKNSRPESAFVAFSNNSKPVIVVGTSIKSRKYKNIESNPSVAIVIADESAEVQYEGKATIASGNEADDLQDKHFRKLPGSVKFRDDPTQTYIKIEPTWMRYIKHGEPDIVEEFTEFAE